MSPAPADGAAVLADLERRLDPAAPERTEGLAVIAYGEVSACLRVAGLPGFVSKRMSGFADAAAAQRYADLVREYLAALASAGVAVVDTHLVPVERPGRPPVVHLVQPELPADTLGHRLLVTADDATVADAVGRVLATTLRLATANRDRGDGLEVAVDGQLSNWSFPAPAKQPPVLVDVGTPFLRRDGEHRLDLELLHRPIPPGIRAYYRWRGEVGAYVDEYFDPRLVAVDLLGNFHKEGRPDRIPLGVAAVNRWLADHADVVWEQPPVTVDEVRRYYEKDAGLLALYLRLRKADRFLRTRLLRRPYDYVLPERVDR